jgi:drug/metabolite transporter (DMT)-like permease
VLIQFTAPILVALWAMLAQRRPVRRTIWVALALALAGIALLAEVWEGFGLDGLGVAAAAGAAFALAAYFLLGEHAVTRRDPVSLLTIALAFATVFWAVTQPWWSFPFDVLSGRASLGGNLDSLSLPTWALVAWMVGPGTILPFGLGIGALRHLPATHVALVAMVEPVAAGFVAWAWLDEALGVAQLAGVAVTLVGIALAQTSTRSD